MDQMKEAGGESIALAAPAARVRSHAFRWLYPFDYPLIVYLAVAGVVAVRYELPLRWEVAFDFRLDLLFLLAGSPLCLAAVYVWQRNGVGLSVGEIGKVSVDVVRRWLSDWQLWYEVLRCILAVKLCMAVYSHLKQELPLLNPRTYDSQLATIDRWLHLGISPAEALTSLHQSRPFMLAMDFLYSRVWYALAAPVIVFFIFYPNRARRRHFMTAFLLTWMIGGAFAIAFPSLGPVYVQPQAYEAMGAPGAAELQAMLWGHYQHFMASPQQYRTSIYEGIAAFPSLHVAIVVLFTVAMRPWKWVLRPLLVYCFIVQLGSVLLGWHWAVDGYFGAAIALVIFYSTRPLFRDDVNQARMNTN